MAEAFKTKKLSIWAWGVSLIQLYLETYFINRFIISRDNIVVYFMSLIFNCLIFIYYDFDWNKQVSCEREHQNIPLYQTFFRL